MPSKDRENKSNFAVAIGKDVVETTSVGRAAFARRGVVEVLEGTAQLWLNGIEAAVQAPGEIRPKQVNVEEFWKTKTPVHKGVEAQADWHMQVNSTKVEDDEGERSERTRN